MTRSRSRKAGSSRASAPVLSRLAHFRARARARSRALARALSTAPQLVTGHAGFDQLWMPVYSHERMCDDDLFAHALADALVVLRNLPQFTEAPAAADKSPKRGGREGYRSEEGKGSGPPRGAPA